MTTADLAWEGGSLLSCRSGGVEMAMDWDSRAAPSPVQALIFALAGCMASDVVLILEKGRLPLRGLAAQVSAERAENPPRRLLEVTIRFVVTGDVPADKVERAIQLSRDTYCSVWHSMARDIALTTAFEVHPAPAA
jgi:putative redox protein